MNGISLMLPLLFIRLILLRLLNKEAYNRAAHYAPTAGNEKVALILYQLSNLFLIFYPLVLTIKTTGIFFFTGLTIFILGTLLLALSTVSFTKPGANGLNTGGIYRFSRNPMYVGYFLYYLGCVLLTRSLPLLLGLLVFQITTHWIILSEERWCLETFGEAYKHYTSKVRRYL